MLERSTGLPWLGDSLLEPEADTDSSIASLLGGAGSAAMLMASVGPWGAAAPRRDAPTGRRERSAPPTTRRRPTDDAALAADAPAARVGANIEVCIGSVSVDGLGFAPARKTPGWVSRWLDHKATGSNDWSIRL